AEPAVGASLYPHPFPKPGSAEITEYDLARSVQLVSLPVQVCAFPHVVYLRWNHYSFKLREKPGLPCLYRCLPVGKGTKKLAHSRLDQVEVFAFGGQIENHCRTVGKQPADLFEI